MPIGRWARTHLLSTLVLVGAGLVAARSDAAPVTRNVERFTVKARSGNDAGAARALAHAPSELLRSVVTDYARYSSIIAQFKNARVVGRAATHTDVYLEVPILSGFSTIWAILRFEAPTLQGDQQVIRGRLLRGNVKRLDATWRIAKVDDQKSVLTLELSMVPDFPAPASLVTGELKKAAGKAVNAARIEAEERIRRTARRGA
jgi:ribosome-associated toxin RatA of RatAB toxin-antitoxin module